MAGKSIRSLQDRFDDRVAVCPSGCHIWAGPLNEHGYGYMRPFTKVGKLAHHVAWFLRYGVWPERLMHRCDNPPCVRVEHLQEGTQAENLADMAAKGRSARGSRNGRAKLTETDIEDLRWLRGLGASYSAIARAYGLSMRTISLACRGKTWRAV